MASSKDVLPQLAVNVVLLHPTIVIISGTLRLYDAREDFKLSFIALDANSKD